jgi:hypothetical protein
MPLLHSSTGRISLMFSNYPSHYFFAFLPHMWKQLIKGTSTLELAGVKYKWTDTERYGIFKYILMTGAFIAIGKALGYDMGWQYPTQQVPSGNIAGTPVPVLVSPPTSLLIDIGTVGLKILLGKTENMDNSIHRVFRDVNPNFIQNTLPIIQGEKPPLSLFNKMEEEEVTYGGGRSRGTRGGRGNR